MSEFKNTGVDFWLWDIILPALVGAAVGLLCLLLGLLFAFWMLTRQLRKSPEKPEDEPTPDPPKVEAGSAHNFDRGSGAEDYESDVRAFGFGFHA